MSIVKATANSRWKGALLAAVAAGVLAPAAAHANLSIDLTFGASNPYGGATAFFVTPSNSTSDIPVYVYATITGTGVLTTPVAGTSTTPPQVTAGDFSGLQYLYYNIINTGKNEVSGGIDAANGPVLNHALGFDGYGTQPNPASATAVGAQVGTVVNSAPTGTTPGLSVGSFATLATATTSTAITAALEAIPKPRANSPVFQNYATSVTSASGTTTYTSVTAPNIIINSATSVSFLVETLNFKAGSFSPSTIASPIETTLGAALPTLVSQENIAEANFYQDVANQNSGTSQATSTATVAPGATATLFNALPGDALGQGSVTFADLSTVLTHYNLTDPNWSDGNFSLGADPKIDFSDLSQVLTHYNNSLIGSTPQTVPADAAVLADPAAVAALEAAGFTPVAVPEPTTLSVLALAGIVGMSRRSNRFVR